MKNVVGLILGALICAGAVAEDAAVTHFTIGCGIPGAAPDGETPVSVVGLSHAPDGTWIASVLTDKDNIALMEFHDDAWVFQDFVATVTKSPWHSYAVEMTGKVFTDNGVPEGTPLLASALTADGRHYSATAAGIWDDTTTPSVLIHPLEGSARALAAGPDGAIAFGTDQGLIYRPDASSGFTQLTPHDDAHEWQSPRIDAAAFDGEGRLWIAGDRGIGAFDSGSWALYPREESATYTAMAMGASGAVWIGTMTGLLRLNDGAWTEFGAPGSLPDAEVRAIVVDESGSAWVATTGGISRIAATAEPVTEVEEGSVSNPTPAREAFKDIKGVACAVVGFDTVFG